MACFQQVIGSTRKGLFPNGNGQCLKVISFLLTHMGELKEWAWTLVLLSNPKSPLSKSLCGPCGPSYPSTPQPAQQAPSIYMAQAHLSLGGLALRSVLQFGFSLDWCDRIMNCITSTSFSFLINGTPQGHFNSSRGIRQGDPLLFYIFILSIDPFIRQFNLLASSARSNDDLLSSSGGFHISNLFLLMTV